MNRRSISVTLLLLSLNVCAMEDPEEPFQKSSELKTSAGKLWVGAAIVGGFLASKLIGSGKNAKISTEKKLAKLEKKLNATNERLDKITELLEKQHNSGQKKRPTPSTVSSGSENSIEYASDEELPVEKKSNRRERPRSTHLQPEQVPTVSSSKKQRHKSDRVLRPSRTESAAHSGKSGNHASRPGDYDNEQEIIPVSRRSDGRRVLERSFSADTNTPAYVNRGSDRPSRPGSSSRSSTPPRGSIESIEEEMRESSSGESYH